MIPLEGVTPRDRNNGGKRGISPILVCIRQPCSESLGLGHDFGDEVPKVMHRRRSFRKFWVNFRKGGLKLR